MLDGLQFSESTCKATCEKSESAPGYPRSVSRDIVTSYVVARVWQHRRAGGQTKDLLALGGLNPTAASQLLSESTQVGPKTETQWAKALGFRDVDALRVAASEWYLSEHRRCPPAAEEAIRTIVDMGQTTEGHAREIVTAFSSPRFASRDAGWWLRELLLEIAIDKARGPSLELSAPANTTKKAKKST